MCTETSEHFTLSANFYRHKINFIMTRGFKNDSGSNEEVQTSVTSNGSEEVLIREDLSAYSFQKFAATYFIRSVSHNFSKRPLKSSLLDLPLPGQLSAQALWITILRFMGDIGEAKYENEITEDIQGAPKKLNIMQKLTSTLNKGFINSKDYQEMLKYGEMEKKLINRTLRKKNKLPREVRILIENSTDIEQYQDWLNTRSGNLEKLHFIIGHGILRKELRDEIYCQICKQLSSNPNSISFRKGWILLSLCIGCFPPSENFELYLREFIRNGPELYAPYCEGRLDRTLQNGARKQPPSYMELRASKNKEPIMVTISFMNETSIELEIDSATTSEEICIKMAKAINLKDILGFSLFITISNKVMSLGCEREFIFDAISNCEQFAKEQGIPEKNIKWQLFIQKEMFVPWHNPSDDPIATELIFQQIMKGINFGDYICTSQKDLAMIAALHYYAEFGGSYSQQKMLLKLSDYLPKAIYKPETASQWEKLIETAFVRCRCKKENLPQIAAKEDIVYFAKITWTLKFSRFFEVLKVEEGIDYAENVLIFAMNWTGVYLIDNQEQVLVELSYPEIYNVSHHSDDENEDILTIQTVTKEILNFKSREVPIIFKWLNYLLTQLKKKSVYAVSLHRFSKTDSEDTEAKYLELKRGDLITLEQNGDALMKTDSTWALGTVGELKGYFPIDNIYVLPCIIPPKRNILEMFTKDTIKEKKQTKAQYNTMQRQKMSTLRNFAAEYFRPNIDVSNAYGTINTLRKQKGNLWSYSREPIKAPLLMKLSNDNEMFDQAVQIFVFIMKYMGDLPQIRTQQLNTDEIFATALENDLLRDEVYCQIMKQLTENTLPQSEERAWDLMWLASGLMIPSQILLKELHEFLKSRPHPIAKECQLRLQKTIKNGNRKFPPYIVEVESIRSRSIQIYHKIYFPDDTDEAFLIESSTKAKDLINRVIQSFKIKSSEGFSLFVKIADKVISVPDEFYIFDFIFELVEWTKSHLPSRSNEQQVQCHYQIFFLKKLWLNFTPGKDLVADSTFYFFQERPKYLNGYYKINKTDAIQIAALIYRSHFGNDHTKFQNHKGLINELVPDDLRSILKIDDWKKQIINAYSKQTEFDEDECKLEFLKFLQKQATFGSTFFVVNQNTAINYPSTILIAINRHGFHILDPVKKDNLKSYDFSELNFWSSGNTFFQITFGNMMVGSKLLCETTQGYKLDDLLSSYIKYFNV